MKNKKTILVVEDEKSLVQVIEKKFTNEGFKVVEAKNGIEGLEKTKKEKPDLILLDIVMPKMDGITMLQKLREEKWGKDIPVIFLTNLSETERVSEVTKKDMNDYLIKSDWSLDDVVNKVRERLKIDA